MAAQHESDNLLKIFESFQEYHRRVVSDSRKFSSHHGVHIFDHDKVANTQQANSPDNKKRQDDQFFFDLKVYEKLKVDIISSINACIAVEKEKQNALQGELQKYAKNQHDFLDRRDETDSEANKIKQEMIKNAELINQLKKQMEQQIKILNDNIAALSAFIRNMDVVLMLQKNSLLDQFRAEVRDMLFANYGQSNKDHIEIQVGAEKVLLTFQETEKLINSVAQSALDRNVQPGSAEFKQEVKKQFSALISLRVSSAAEKHHVNKAAEDITHAITPIPSESTNRKFEEVVRNNNLQQAAKKTLDLLNSIVTNHDTVSKQASSATPSSALAKQLAQENDHLKRKVSSADKISRIIISNIHPDQTRLSTLLSHHHSPSKAGAKKEAQEDMLFGRRISK